MWQKRRLLLAIALCASPAASWSLSVDRDCSPSGPVAIVKEKLRPHDFWTTVLKELEQHARAAQSSYRVFKIEQEQARINAQFEDEKNRAMGFPQQQVPPQLQKSLSDGDRFIEELEVKMTRSALELADRCSAYANAKLSAIQLKR